MMRKLAVDISTRVVSVMLWVVLTVPAALVAQDSQVHHNRVRYSLTVLGTLGGTFGEAHGLNNRGSAAGQSTLPGEALHAFFRHKGVIADLGTLGGPDSLVNVANHTVNDSDTVVGFSETSTPDPNEEDFCVLPTGLVCLPFVWEYGVLTALPTLGGNNGQALGVNNRGQIVGQAETPNSDPCSPFAQAVKAVIWQHGAVQEVLGSLGGTAAVANAINDTGQVVGLSGCAAGNFFAVLWNHGNPVNLGTLGGASGNIPFDINNQGQVVGQSDLPGDTVHHAFLWQDGVMSDLGSLSVALPTSLASGINNRGQVVGFSEDAAADDPSAVAVLWESGRIIDLNTVIPAGSPLFLMEAAAINDRGEIGGWGRLANGEHRAFLLTPCDGDRDDCDDAKSSAADATAPQATTGTIDAGSSAAGPGRASLSGTQALPAAHETNPDRRLFLRRSGLGRFTGGEHPDTNTAATSGPSAILSPTSLNFSTESVGTASAADTVTLKNTGTTSLTISSIAITGSDPADFAQTHTCGSSLAPGASCTINVNFKPIASGTRTAAVSVRDSAAASPQSVSLTGIGTTARLSPATVNFGVVSIGTTTLPQNVTLTNIGTTVLRISSVSVSGLNAGDFAQTHTCGSSLAAGASCTVSVTFRPRAKGTRTAQLVITDNAAGGAQNVALTGAGTLFRCASIGQQCYSLQPCCPGLQCVASGDRHVCARF